MPRWEVHLSVASMALLVVITGAILGLYQSGLSLHDLGSIIPFISALVFGSMAFLLGSVLPDIDGKGKIRWTAGPILGSFVLLPPLLWKISEGDLTESFDLLWGPGVRYFFVFTLIGTVLALLPMKHRGRIHTIQFGAILASAWGIYIWSTTSLGLEFCILVGAMGLIGYLWHLSLDGKVTGKNLFF